MKLGIIGGSGLDDPKIIQDARELDVQTPYGKPSSTITNGKISGVEVFILSRHGKKHEIPPTQVNNRANIYSLKQLGCTHVIATTAVGSLKEEIKRGDFVVLDSFIDFTRHRKTSFFESFEKGIKHLSLANPFSLFLRNLSIESLKELNIPFHSKGTVITIEGPRFSTIAESKMFRSWGAEVINMSIAPEAILAREAELEYSALAMATDYDCWKEDEAPVSWESILEIFQENSEKMKKLLLRVIEKMSSSETMKRDVEIIKNMIRTVPNFPKPGIMFRDITTLLKDPDGFSRTMKIFEDRYKNKDIDLIAGIESRGFILAAALASRLGKGLVLIRKSGKLPSECIKQEYGLEYGKDCIEIHKDAIKPGQKILVLDDLIATGGTAVASCSLIEKLGGEFIELACIVELEDLEARKKFKEPEKIFSILKLKESD